MIGQTLARYKVIERISSAGMVDIYLAEDSDFGRKVALKVLSRASGEVEQEQFTIRNRIGEELLHPNVCEIFEVAQTDEGCAYVAMEYVEGESLQQRINNGPLPTTEALRLAVKIAAGLTYAHSEGIVHRNLKPSKIMLTPRNEVKLLDFSLGRRVPREAPETDSAQPRLPVGTLAYMSPEQIRGGECDQRSDIFSLGVVLYEVLSGRHPFLRKEGIRATATSILREQPQLPISSFLSEAFPNLNGIVMKMLEKNPVERYDSMSSVKQDLQSLLKTREDTLAQ